MSKRLPPLNAIRTFDTAARHLSFARAADDLGITPSAVSKQIAILEDFIGGKLFERIAGGVSLTLEGRELKHTISPAFTILNTSFDRYSRRKPRSQKFRLATVASFASCFLVPRLDAFEQAFPNVELEILTSDRVLNLSREEVDLSIRYGAGEWENLVSHPLVPAKLIPVCAPTLWEQTKHDVTKLVSTARHIQTSSTNEWRMWQNTSAYDIPQPSRTIVMEHFLVALQATIAEQGIALLPEIIVHKSIADNKLVQFSPAIDWSQNFFVTHVLHADKNTVTREIIAWFRHQVELISV